MTTLVWSGSDGNWGNTNNWNPAGTLPASNDTVILPGSNSVSIASGLDQGGIDLDLLQIDKGYVGNVGTSGNPLKIDADKVIHQGIGSLHFQSDGDGTNNLVTDWMIVDSDNPVQAASLDGREITKITIAKGNVTLEGTLGSTSSFTTSAVKTNILEIVHRTNSASDAQATVNAQLKATSGTLRMTGGIMTSAGGDASNPGIPVLIQTGGILTHNDGSAITTAHLLGGWLIYKSSKTLVTANIHKGATLDMTGNSLTKTITIVNIYPGGTLIYNSDLTSIGALNRIGGGGKVISSEAGMATPAGARLPT